MRNVSCPLNFKVHFQSPTVRKRIVMCHLKNSAEDRGKQTDQQRNLCWESAREFVWVLNGKDEAAGIECSQRCDKLNG